MKRFISHEKNVMGSAWMLAGFMAATAAAPAALGAQRVVLGEFFNATW